jgi:hypothetical protein
VLRIVRDTAGNLARARAVEGSSINVCKIKEASRKGKISLKACPAVPSLESPQSSSRAPPGEWTTRDGTRQLDGTTEDRFLRELEKSEKMGSYYYYGRSQEAKKRTIGEK